MTLKKNRDCIFEFYIKKVLGKKKFPIYIEKNPEIYTKYDFIVMIFVQWVKKEGLYEFFTFNRNWDVCLWKVIFNLQNRKTDLHRYIFRLLKTKTKNKINNKKTK